jgi:carbon-monoxide dehydrogenase iron sulfur subunit
MRFVAVDADACVACRDCEYACAFQHTADFDRDASYIRVNFYPEERACIALTCMHCEKAWCLEVCPAGAISRNPQTRAIEVDSALCAGCKMCLLACPFGNMHFDAVRGVSGKCDLCGGDPACVRFCTSGALRFIEADEAVSTQRTTLDLRLIRLLHRPGEEG